MLKEESNMEFIWLLFACLVTNTYVVSSLIR
jgi:hypothetical protein